MEKKPFVVYISDNTTIKERKAVYEGHIVHCKDVDGGTEFNVEVNVLSTLSEEEKVNVAIKAAAKTEPISLLGENTVEYEYMQPSGKVFEFLEYKFRTQTQARTKEAEEILDKVIID